MNLKMLCLLLIFTSCSKNISKNAFNSTNIDSIYVSWNELALKSLSNRIELTRDTFEKKFLENFLSLSKISLQKEQDIKIRKMSLNYNFLKELKHSNFNLVNQDLYIIRADRSGEYYQIVNFIIFINKEGNYQINSYKYQNQKWIKKDEKIEKGENLISENFNNYRSKFGEGVNQDEVIITKFENFIPVKYEFYPLSTLNEGSILEKIIRD